MSAKFVRLTLSNIASGGNNHREYRVGIEQRGPGKYVVLFQYGRIGSALRDGSKTPIPVSMEEAERTFNKVVSDQIKQGYQADDNSDAFSSSMPVVRPIPAATLRTPFPVELLTEITDKEAEKYLKSPDYFAQIKIDGHRRQLRLFAGTYSGFNKLGSLVPVSQSLASDLAVLKLDSFFIDGELVGDDYIAFDLLEINGNTIAALSYGERLKHLEAIVPKRKARSHFIVIPTWKTVPMKKAGLQKLRELRAEGIVYKNSQASYRAGRNGCHFKQKFLKTCTAKVIRIGDKGHDSATLALYDAGQWREVGRASMIGKDKRIGLNSLVEVKFLYIQGENGRLYQPRIIALRTDVDESECTMAQLKTAYKFRHSF